MSVFIDTSALLALISEDDRYHGIAMTTWSSLIDEQTEMFSTNYVVVEAISIAQARWGLGPVRVLENSILPPVQIHWVTEAEHEQALLALFHTGRRQLGLVDLTSFTAMRHRRASSCFTFDAHFREAGFAVVPVKQ